MFKKNDVTWLYCFALIDIFIVSITIIEFYLPKGIDLLGYGTLLSLLGEVSLSNEMTFGVWWAGVHLIISSFICYELYDKENAIKFAWAFNSVIFIGLSFDEMASIHERFLNSWYVIIAIFLIGIFPFLYAQLQLLRRNKWKTAALILLGMGMMASAAPLEYLEHHLTWPSSLIGLRVGLEEGMEIFGALICLTAVVRQRSGSCWSNPLSRVIPNPTSMRRLLPLSIVAFSLHLLLSFYTANFLDVTSRGNPAVYIPSVFCLIIAFSIFWEGNVEKNFNNKKYVILCFCYVMLSFATFYLMSPESTISYLVFIGEITERVKINTLFISTFLLFSFVIYELINMDVILKLYVWVFGLSSLVLSYTVWTEVSFYTATGLVHLLTIYTIKISIDEVHNFNSRTISNFVR